MYVIPSFDVFCWEFIKLETFVNLIVSHQSEFWKELSITKRNRNWTGKLKNLHLIQSERGSLVCNAILASKISSTNTLDWILSTDFIWEKTSSFSYPPYMVKVLASVLFCFFFSLDFVVGWTKLGRSCWNADHADCADCADWVLFFFLLVP